MTESSDQWFRHFEIMVTSHFPVPGEEADPTYTASILAIWNQHFGSSHRVYEKQHPFPGLIVNYEDGSDDEDRNPSWLSKMFEYGPLAFLGYCRNSKLQLLFIVRVLFISVAGADFE